ncbi:guanyl-nucleotide exchange factor [Entamoeba marina]
MSSIDNPLKYTKVTEELLSAIKTLNSSSSNDPLSEANQDVVCMVLKTSLWYLLHVKATSKLTQLIINFLTKEYVTISTVQYTLEALHALTEIQILSPYSELVLFIGMIIQSTMSFDIKQKYQMNNFKFLIDLFMLTPSTSTSVKQLLSYIQNCINTSTENNQPIITSYTQLQNKKEQFKDLSPVNEFDKENDSNENELSKEISDNQEFNEDDFIISEEEEENDSNKNLHESVSSEVDETFLSSTPNQEINMFEQTDLLSFNILQFITNETSNQHKKTPFHSKMFLNVDWSLIENPNKFIKREERLLLTLLEYWLSKCPTTISPHQLQNWNVSICNCICCHAFSDEQGVFRITLKIFINWNDIKNVYFFYVKSPLPTLIFKSYVIQELTKLSTLPQLLIDIFLNYDCDFNGLDLLQEYVELIHFVLSPLFKQENTEEVSMKVVWDIRKLCYKGLLDFIVSIRLQLQSLVKMEKNGVYGVNGPELIKTAFSSIKQLVDYKRKSNYKKAQQLFSTKPTKAVELLIEAQLCNDTPEEIALFLYQSTFDKTALGKYITGNTTFQKDVFSAFMKQIDFKQLSVDKALRKMFKIFVMPGEGQIVDRVMESFAQRYFDCWGDDLKEVGIDAPNKIYFLATTIIFLSTETHNNNVKTKTMDTYEKFKSMIEQFDFTLPDEYLQPLYEDVTKDAFLFPSDASSNNNEKMFIATLKANPNKRQHILLLSSEIEDKLDCITPQPSLGVSLITKDVLTAFFQASLPQLLKCLCLTFDTYNEVEQTLNYFKHLAEISVGLHLNNEITTIVEVLTQWSVCYQPKNKKKQHIQTTQLLFELCCLYKQELQLGWKYVFVLLSRLEKAHIIDKEKIVPLTTIPKNDRSLFFMDVEHVFYSPKDSKPIILSSSETSTIKKALDKDLPITSAAFDEINCVDPPLFLIRKFSFVLHDYFIKEKRTITQEIVQLTTKFLIQCALHPHEVIAKDAIKTIFIFEQRGFFNQEQEPFMPLLIPMSDSPLSTVRIYILEIINEALTKKINTLSDMWKGIFAVLYIAALDSDVMVLKKGYTLLRTVGQHYEVFNQNYLDLYMKNLIKYILSTDRSITEDKQSEPYIITTMSSILQPFKNQPNLNFSVDSTPFKTFFLVLSSFAITASSFKIDIASLSLQSIIREIDAFDSYLTYDSWYFIFHNIFIKILEPIGYFHHKTNVLSDAICPEWITSICLTLLLQISSFITQKQTILEPFLGDLLFMSSTLFLKGTTFISKIGLLVYKDILPYFFDHLQSICLLKKVNNNVMQYLFDAILSFNLQNSGLETELNTNQYKSTTPETCEKCGKSLRPFLTIKCDLCEKGYCSLECLNQTHTGFKHQTPQIKSYEEQFVPVEFIFSSVDVTVITSVTLEYFNIFTEILPKLIQLPFNENQVFILQFITQMERYLNVLQQTNQTAQYYPSINSIVNEVQIFLISYSKQLYNAYPNQFITLLPQLFKISSTPLLLHLLDLLNVFDDTLLIQASDTCYLSLLQLIPHPDLRIRQELTNLLIKIHKLNK